MWMSFNSQYSQAQVQVNSDRSHKTARRKAHLIAKARHTDLSLWHVSIFHADIVTYTDLCLICNRVLIFHKKPTVAIIRNKMKLYREKKRLHGFRARWTITQLAYMKVTHASLFQPGKAFFHWLFKIVIIWRTSWRSKFGRKTRTIVHRVHN